MSTRTLFTKLLPRKPFVCISCRSRCCEPSWWAAQYSTRNSRVLDRASSVRDRGRSNRRIGDPSPKLAQDPSPKIGGSSPRVADPGPIENEAASSDADFSVRYFEQDDTGTERELPDEDAFNNSFNGFPEFPGVGEIFEALKEDKDLAPIRHAIQGIQAGIEARTRGITDPDAKEQAIKMYLQTLSQKFGGNTDSEEAREEYQEAVDEIDRELDPDKLWQGFVKEEGHKVGLDQDAMSGRPAVPQIPTEPTGPWNSRQLLHISRLNLALKRRAHLLERGGKLSERLVFVTWKAYHAARKSMSVGWSHVPNGVWSLLWMIVSTDSDGSKVRRMANIATLATDMVAAGAPLTAPQQLLAVEALLASGHIDDAIGAWKRALSVLGHKRSSSFQPYWELGVRLFCKLGDMEEVDRAIGRLLAHGCDGRVLQHLIRTYSTKGTAEDHTKAWETYRRMRGVLARSIKIEDFDEVISVFLASGQMENALQAFVDMMTDGQVVVTRSEYERLPSGIGNKYFFGKWIKRLIWMSDLDGAAAVVKFMQEKGVEPAAVHLNGLIGAWQRTDKPENLTKADDMAWRMVEARLTFVGSRAAERGLVQPLRLIRQMPQAGPSMVPRATLETFKLMANHYRARRLHDSMLRLWTAFQDAEILVDTFMMNRILESYLLAGQLNDGLRFYEAMARSTDKATAPDAGTFAILFDMLAIHRTPSRSSAGRQAETHQARRLFAELMGHVGRFPADDSLARAVLHTFRRLRDHAGLVIGLVALRTRFQYAPSQLLAIELLAEVRGLALDSPTGRDRARRGLVVVQQEMRRLAGSVQGFAEMDPADRICICLQSLYTSEALAGMSSEDKLAAYERIATEMGASEVLQTPDDGAPKT